MQINPENLLRPASNATYLPAGSFTELKMHNAAPRQRWTSGPGRACSAKFLSVYQAMLRFKFDQRSNQALKRTEDGPNVYELQANYFIYHEGKSLGVAARENGISVTHVVTARHPALRARRRDDHGNKGRAKGDRECIDRPSSSS